MAKPKSQARARAQRIEIIRKRNVTPQLPEDAYETHIDSEIESNEQSELEEQQRIVEEMVERQQEEDEEAFETNEILQYHENNSDFDEDI